MNKRCHVGPRKPACKNYQESRVKILGLEQPRVQRTALSMVSMGTSNNNKNPIEGQSRTLKNSPNWMLDVVDVASNR